MEAQFPTREQMQDELGRPLTQSLFLEVGYSKAAVFTLKEVDYMYEGKLYPSLKRLYLAEEDPTEYTFATKYLLGWKHWLRLCDNKVLRAHIDEWREELEIKLRSRAVQEMIKNSRGGKLVASKWLAEKGWANRRAGRPSKSEVEAEKKILAAIDNEYTADVVRLREVKTG